MLIYINGDMFSSPAQVLVNTVNTVGVMGKGVALTFKKIYPDMYDQYKIFCDNRQLTIGKLQLYKTPGKWILNFPTKENWRNPSKLEYIEAGLKKFSNTYKEKGIKSIAFPMLGCGNGGLDFETQVKPLMDKYLSSLDDIDIFVYLKDMTNIPEHNDISSMKLWLNSNIQNISALEFEQDLIDYSNGIAEVFNNSEDDSLQFNGEYIDYSDILSLWTSIKDKNILYMDKFINEQLTFISNESKIKLKEILEKIPYIDTHSKTIEGDSLLVYMPFRRAEGLRLC